jgi:hypothetical protein
MFIPRLRGDREQCGPGWRRPQAKDPLVLDWASPDGQYGAPRCHDSTVCRQISRNNLLTFPAQVNDTAPFARPTKHLAACRLAIVTTAGVHVRGDRLFTPGDQTYRVIPSGTPAVGNETLTSRMIATRSKSL